MLGTNPIAVAVPTDEAFPYMFDAATSVVPRGKIEVATRANKPLPEGWVIDQEGASVTDSSQMIAEMNVSRCCGSVCREAGYCGRYRLLWPWMRSR
jgi:LDH2 family malate/lactate/ureidoglycolate dehydrogenase